MELIYAYIEKYRNYKQVEFSFSNKFFVDFDKSKSTICIEKNEEYTSIYPDYITNINAVVGKNSTGKTNLADLIGMKIEDRNKHKEEFQVIYKNSHSRIHRPGDVKSEIKYSIYFFLYYLGNDRFCIEGNDIDSFNSLFINKDDKNDGIGDDYWREKYWFAFVCLHNEGKLEYLHHLNYRLNDNDASESYKLGILSFREKFNSRYYDWNSFKPQDDYKICVPRRICKFNTNLLKPKVKMLFEFIKDISNHKIFNNENYEIIINYQEHVIIEERERNNEMVWPEINIRSFRGKERYIVTILDSFCKYFFNSIIDRNNETKRQHVLKRIREIANASSWLNYDDIIDNLKLIIKEILSEESHLEENDKNYILNKYNDLISLLKNNKSIKFEKGEILIEIRRDISEDIKKDIFDAVTLLIDESYKEYDSNQSFSAFDDFFSYTILNLSDGEQAYLRFYSSLWEQINLLAVEKEHYIVFLDEPEARMHPDLARNFINDLILFLEPISNNKTFQILIATHSPFILSDIPQQNIVFLKKTNGVTYPEKGLSPTFGANIHELLKDGFFMDSTLGEYALQSINEVINYLNKAKMNVLNDEFSELKYKVKQIIDLIGEPLIKNKLLKIYYEIYPEEQNDAELIKYYKDRLNKIESQSKAAINEEALEKLKFKMIQFIESIAIDTRNN